MTAANRCQPAMKLVDVPRYHRNGCAGVGFFAVGFAAVQRDGRTWKTTLRAVVTLNGDDAPHPDDQAYVFDPCDRDSGFDGGFFLPTLREWCIAASRDMSAHLTAAEHTAAILAESLPRGTTPC